jgi:hypothetical protein
VGWKTVNVFVSSTFDDMHAERDYLVKKVFPRLREWCEQRRLRLVDVDLRWGVTVANPRKTWVSDLGKRGAIIAEVLDFAVRIFGQRPRSARSETRGNARSLSTPCSLSGATFAH